MIKDLAIIGQPGYVGGANTELAHQIICWQEMGINIHIMPSNRNLPDEKKQPWVDMGCNYLQAGKWAQLRDLHCISFCNKSFLQNIRMVKVYAKKVMWVNCMTWAFRREKEMQAEGLIDFHLYQTQHAKKRIQLELSRLGKPYRDIMFSPYFHQEDFPFIQSRPMDCFRFGRISRDDAAKFHPLQFEIYNSMKSPREKEAYVLGWGESPDRKIIGERHKWIKLLKPNQITQNEFYGLCECVIMATSTFENLPRVGFESMASGSILVVDDKGGWRNQVEDGVTGFLCKDTNDFIKKSTILAHDDELRNTMRINAKAKLEKEWGMERSIKSWTKVFEEVENTKI